MRRGIIFHEAMSMRFIEQWRKQTDEDKLSVDHFTRVTWKYFAPSQKGKAFVRNNDLADLISDGIIEYIDENRGAGFTCAEGTWFISIETCPKVFRCVEKVIGRVYKNLRDRGETELLDAHFAMLSYGDGRTRESSLDYIDELPKELADLIRSLLLAMQMSPDGNHAQFVMGHVGIGKSTYYVRLKRATERLVEILGDSGWNFKPKLPKK